MFPTVIVDRALVHPCAKNIRDRALTLPFAKNILLSMEPRPSKRQRARDTSYHDAIPMPDDFELVQAREGRLRRVGNNLWMAPLARTTHHETPSWANATSWAPTDDNEFALDPGGGDWYNEVVEADVMADFVPDVPQKKRYLRSKVSVSYAYGSMISFSITCCYIETPTRRMEGNASSVIP